MSLSQDGYAFLSHNHGAIESDTPYQKRLIINSPAGVDGESHIHAQKGGRQISCQFDMTGYATHAALEAKIAELESQFGTLTGDLTVTIDSQAEVYPDCTFLGFQQNGKRFKDPNNNWTVFGRLVWRQRSTNATS